MKKGTSLIELLVVLVVMGIIAAIVIPTAGALIENSRKKACKISIENICASYQSLVQFENIVSDEERYEYLDEVMQDYNVIKIEKDGKIGYKGICKSEGIYYFSFDSYGQLSGYCSEH